MGASVSLSVPSLPHLTLLGQSTDILKPVLLYYELFSFTLWVGAFKYTCIYIKIMCVGMFYYLKLPDSKGNT